MDIQEEIAQVLHSVCGCADGPSEDTYYEAGLLVPLVRRAQAEALRQASRKAQEAFVAEQGGIGYARVRTDWLHAEANRIEKEGAGA